MLRRIAQILLGAILLVVLIWAAWPWWFPSVARVIARDAGVQLVEIEIARPWIDGVQLHRLQARMDTLDVQIDSAWIGWSLNGLQLSRLDALQVRRLEIVQTTSPGSSDESTAPLDSNIVPLVPVDQLVVNELIFRAPDLPLRLQGDFRLMEREINLRLEATESPAGIPVRMTLRLDEQGQFLARLHSNDDKDVHAIEARGALKDGILDVAGMMDLRDYELRLMTGLSGLTPMGGLLTGPFRAQFDKEFVLQNAEVEPTLSLQAESEQGRKRRFSLQGHASWRAVDEGGVASLVLTDTSASRTTTIDTRVHLAPEKLEAKGSFALSRSDFSSLAALMDLPDLEGAGRGDFTVSSPLPWSMEAAAASARLSFELRYEKITDLKATLVDLERRADEPWSLTVSGLDFKQSEAGEVTTFVAPQLAGNVVPDASGAFSFSTRGDVGWSDATTKLMLKGADVVGTGSLLDATWKMQFNVEHQGQKLVMDVSADEDFDRVTWRAPIDWRVREPLLSKQLNMKADYDIVAGHFTGTLEGSMQGDSTQTKVQGAFNDGRLTYGEYEAKDVSAAVSYALAPDGQFKAALQDLRIGVFDPGVPVTDIRTSLRADDKSAHVEAMNAVLLGGTVKTTPFTWFMAPGEASFDVSVEGLDLGALLALEGEDLNGTGTLQGKLPVRMTGGAVTVVDGALHTVGPGVIRIAPSLTRVMNQPGLDFALRALEDFSYTSLDADVNYEADGDLLAAIRLKGRNPAIEKGRPIHYNLNVSENIPSLLASLRIQDDVNERIERRVRAGTKSGASRPDAPPAKEGAPK